MDILGFALYHENNSPSDSAAPEEEDNKRQLTPDSSMEELGGDADEDASVGVAAAKKQRINEESSDPRNDLKYQIWEEISKGDGEASINAMCPGVEDRDEVIAAVSEMEEEGRVMISEGKVYQID